MCFSFVCKPANSEALSFPLFMHMRDGSKGDSLTWRVITPPSFICLPTLARKWGCTWSFYELRRALCEQELRRYHYWTDFWHSNTSVSLTFKMAAYWTLLMFWGFLNAFRGFHLQNQPEYPKLCASVYSIIMSFHQCAALCKSIITAIIYQ